MVPVGIVTLTALVTREEIRTLGEAFAEMVTASDRQPGPETDIGWSHPNRHYILERLEVLFEGLWEDGVALPTPGDS